MSGEPLLYYTNDHLMVGIHVVWLMPVPRSGRRESLVKFFWISNI